MQNSRLCGFLDGGCPRSFAASFLLFLGGGTSALRISGVDLFLNAFFFVAWVTQGSSTRAIWLLSPGGVVGVGPQMSQHSHVLGGF